MGKGEFMRAWKAGGRRTGGGKALGVIVAVLVGIVLLPGRAVSTSLPSWVRDAMAKPTPDWAPAPALVLLDEESVDATNRGRVITTRRFAVRVLDSAGARAAACATRFVRGMSEVRELRAWRIDPRGRVREWAKSEAIEASLTPGHALYGDVRTLVLVPDSAPVGSVFAWESREEATPLLAQWRWGLREDWPALLSRFSIALPAGLAPEARVFGVDTVQASTGPNGWSWTLGNQRAWRPEPLASTRWSVAPTLVVGAHSVGGVSVGAHFSNWGEVSGWLDGLAADQAEVTPELRARVASLTQASQDTLAQMASLASAVQRLNYLHVQLGFGRGWGYRPNAAADVLRLGYGDCKDKANLLRTFMKAAGYRAWLVAANASERDGVEPGWPSPTQFDHCILAVQAPVTARLPASVRHPALGRLLFFDPTDPFTPFGQLPAPEQGALALIEDADHGGLLRLPVASNSEDRLSRRIEVTLDASGAVRGSLQESSCGSHAAGERALRHRGTEAEYRDALARRLGTDGGVPTVTDCIVREDSLAGSFDLRLDFALPRHARLVRDRMLVVRTGLLDSYRAPQLPDTSRFQPVELPMVSMEEYLSMRLPAGFRVDELPDRIAMRTDFGSVDATWRVEEGTLRFERRLDIRPVTLEPTRYEDVRKFYRADADARGGCVVLVRQ
jgi:transglutaminase-like putative cysteine protease